LILLRIYFTIERTSLNEQFQCKFQKKSSNIWDMKWCSLVEVNQSLERTRCLHLQDRIIYQAGLLFTTCIFGLFNILTLKMEAVHSSETLLDFNQAIKAIPATGREGS
jgi:hypothetical protein